MNVVKVLIAKLCYGAFPASDLQGSASAANL